MGYLPYQLVSLSDFWTINTSSFMFFHNNVLMWRWLKLCEPPTIESINIWPIFFPNCSKRFGAIFPSSHSTLWNAVSFHLHIRHYETQYPSIFTFNIMKRSILPSAHSTLWNAVSFVGYSSQHCVLLSCFFSAFVFDTGVNMSSS